MRAATTTKRKVRPPAAYEPHDCVVLAVDTAERSGWAVYIHGQLVVWGEADMLAGPEDVQHVCRTATVAKAAFPIVLVYERPFRGTTQGQWIGAWKAAFVSAGGSKSRMVGVYPASWRARVTGLARAGRELARAGELRRAKQETKGESCGPDAAAAICIGLWAIRAGEVAAKLPKTKRKKAQIEGV